MPISTAIEETRVRVRYAETDAAGIVHHAAYAVWLEAGRVEWLRSRGASYAALEKEGYSLPLVEMRQRFVAPARFDDVVIVRTAANDLRSRTVSFVYEVVTNDTHPRQLMNGMSRHICVRRGAVTRLPPELRGLLG